MTRMPLGGSRGGHDLLNRDRDLLSEGWETLEKSLVDECRGRACELLRMELGVKVGL